MLFNRWGGTSDLMRLDLTDMTQTLVASDYWRRGLYAGSGHIVFGGIGDELLALPAEPSVARAMTAEPVLDNVDGGGGPGYTKISASQEGTLVYGELDSSRRSLALVDSSGRIEPLEAGFDTYQTLSVSPDGRRVALGTASRLFVHDLDRGSRIPLVPELPENVTIRPVWNADGTHIFFSSNHEGTWNIYSKAASGAGSAERVLAGRFDQWPTAVARNGWIVYEENHESTGADIWLLPPGGEPEPWLVTPAEERQGVISPDGRVMAFMTNVSGRFEVAMQLLDRSGDPMSVSTAGGTSPVWSPAGDRLYFREGNRMMVAEVSTRPELAASVPEVLFDAGFELSDFSTFVQANYAVMPDGRFLMVRFEPEAVPSRINVIFNWFAELERLVPVN